MAAAGAQPVNYAVLAGTSLQATRTLNLDFWLALQPLPLKYLQERT